MDSPVPIPLSSIRVSRESGMTQEDRIIFEDAEGEGFNACVFMILSQNDSVKKTLRRRVVIRVEKLSLAEKEQILYNHIKLGTQPKSVKAKIKEHLAEIARHPKFLPETARRIGDPFFTSSISFSRESLLDMAENMRGFLYDTLKHLGTENIAAVALVFMRNGNLDCELQLSEKEQRALDLIGSDLGSVRRACKALGCSVLTKIQNDGQPYWQFKHPSIRDSFGTLIADDPSLREVYLSSTPIRSLSLRC